MNFAKFVRTTFLKNTTRRLLLIIAVSIVLAMKGELASKTVNYDSKTMYQFEPKCSLLRSTIQVKQHVSEAVVRFLKISKTSQENICVLVSWAVTLWKHLFIGKLQWLLLRFKSYFQRSPGQKPMRLSQIHTRFSWKRYLLPSKSRSSYHRCSVEESLQFY